MKHVILSFVFLSVFFSTTRNYAEPLLKKESIFPLQEKHVHSSSIVECSNGDLLVCWFYGSGERTADDVRIQGSRLRNGSTQWETVFEMADTPGFADCNPVLFVDSANRLWLFWVTVLAQRWQESILKYRISDDYLGAGAPQWTWQDIITLKPGDIFEKTVRDGFAELADEPLWAEYALPYYKNIITASADAAKRQTGWMTRIHPFVLPSGRILLPLYSDGYCLGLVAISDDDGKSWRASAPMVGYGLNQPSIVQKQDGSLLAYMRNEGTASKRVPVSTSVDNGETWSYAVDSDIPNPGSSLEVIQIHSGSWLMIYNDTEEGRHRLAAALSDDEGKTWKWHRYIARSAKGVKSFSYPSVIQSRDKLIHLTYSYDDGENETIRYAIFNLDWLREK